MNEIMDEIMAKMPINWRYYWCESEKGCACAGCANRAGQLTKLGYSKKDWEEWIKANPNPF